LFLADGGGVNGKSGKPGVPQAPSINVGGTKKMQWGNITINAGLDTEQRKLQRALEKETART
jgi:hypothetical protein